MKPIPWEQFRVLLNKEGNGLGYDLLQCIQPYGEVEEFIVRKGGFLDVFLIVKKEEDVSKIRKHIDERFGTVGNRVILRYKY